MISSLSLSFPKLSLFFVYLILCNQIYYLGNQNNLHILDSNLIAKSRLTQSLLILNYKFYYFDGFSTVAKSLSLPQ